MDSFAGSVRIEGSGPSLILLHGGPGLTADSVEPISRLLRNNFQVVRFDQQGCSREQGLTVGKLVGQIEELRQWLGEDTVVLLGHSWGAGLAALYADAYPAHVAALVFVHPMEIASHHMAASQKQLEKRRPWKDRWRRWKIFREMRGLPDLSPQRDALESELLLLDFRLTCADQPAGRVLDGLTLSPFDWRAAEMLWNDLERNWPGVEPGSYDLAPVFQRLRAPSLVVVGEQDVIDPRSAQRITELAQGAAIYLLSSGHWSFLEQPQQFESVACEFLRPFATHRRPLKAFVAGSKSH